MSATCSLGGESRSEASLHIDEDLQHEQRDELIRVRDLIRDQRVDEAHIALSELRQPRLTGDRRIRRVLEILKGSPSQAELEEAESFLETVIRGTP